MCWFYESRNPICLHLVSCYIWLFPSFWFSTWLYICLFYACILLFSYKQKFFFLLLVSFLFFSLSPVPRELCEVTNFVKWRTLWSDKLCERGEPCELCESCELCELCERGVLCELVNFVNSELCEFCELGVLRDQCFIYFFSVNIERSA